MPAEDFVQDACGHCDKQFHQMALKTLYTEDESQYDTFCEECIKEMFTELWVNEDK